LASKSTQRCIGQVLGLAVRTLGPDHPNLGGLHSNLANLLIDTGRYVEAENHYRIAVLIGEDALGPDDPAVAIRRSNLGNVLRSTGRLQEARDQFEIALRVSENALGPDHPDVAWGHGRNNLSSVLWEMGDLTAARAQLERAIDSAGRDPVTNHPDLAIWHNNLGNVLAASGDKATANEHFALARELGGDNEPSQTDDRSSNKRWFLLPADG
jgi:tetratricopeptide (TPR) repeat protein